VSALPPPALALEHIVRRFGPVEALADASIVVRPGTVHALLGENGAGKTTLMRIAFGLLRPDGGTVRVHGRPVTFGSPAAAIAHGIGMVHQHFSFVPAMTVTENVALGGRGRYRVSHARRRVEEVAQQIGFDLDPDARAADLPVGAQQRLEIVKALARGARILILDEPTASLAPVEAEELLALLQRFASEGGGSVVIITHKLREALAAAHEVTVLRRGRTVLHSPTALVSVEALAEAVIGEGALRAPLVKGPAHPRAVVLQAHDLVLEDRSGKPKVRGITLTVRGGEILGIAGVEGAGQHELLLALAGRLRPVMGVVRLPERIGFIPEDRHRDALILDFPLYENVALRGAGRARGRIRWREVRRATEGLLARFDVRASSPDQPARALSGGNQQKLVVARELMDAVDALIVENPTRGLDIAATAAVHRQLVAARDAGVAVVVYSSDLDEVLALADRLVVLYAGQAREVPVDRAAAGQAMVGAA
jgi:ABC-type uncharacterized transport system ATPase subunit